MKTFRGTLLAALVLIAVIIFVVFVEKPPEQVGEDADRAIYVFEKQDLVKAHVLRPDGSEITLSETDTGWVIEETGFRASKSMVNRVKHQLHDLTARAQVVEDTKEPALYGLGPSQRVHVTLTMRDGANIEFYGGDPNPSAVSYYIQPLPGETIYTVKKSAVDYYSLDFDDFRERRFAGFNSKDADLIEADLPGGRRLKLQRTGEKRWVMLEPSEMAVSLDKARSLLGRVGALKATDFVVDDPDDLADYGLEPPRARITIAFGTREPMTLLVGTRLIDDSDPPVAYMMLEGDGTVYTAKDQMLEDFLVDTERLREARVVELDEDDVVQVVGTLLRSDDDDALVGEEVTLRKVGDVWQWWDGSPVPGSTPRRLASRVTSLEAEEFVDDDPRSLAPYGLDAPTARIAASDDVGNTKVVLIGDAGPERTDFEDRQVRRLYVMLEGEPNVYLVDWSIQSVLEDALREQRRKKKKVAETQERREKMEDEMGKELPGLDEGAEGQ
ncbi:MAG TPA: DUF4340 domain-containing protein [Myxococcota bacterium]|nr:DUF4340 domain-containing protein [Myxococcota bacterium]